MTDYDSPWKEALDVYFEPFMALFFLDAHADIDWPRGYESLDKELQKIVREAGLGRRLVDKLIKVWLKNGKEQWVLIHIEVQGEEDAEFGQRMYVCNYRIFDRYNTEVVSLAILADENPRWRPDGFGYSRWGFHAGIQFPVVKLSDYSDRVEWLEQHSNPFAIVVLAHLKARKTCQNQEARYSWKARLVKSLYDRGMCAKDVRQLFRFIDWVIDLPKELEVALWHEVKQYEEQKQMPYVISPIRIEREEGLSEGYLRGIEESLDIKFWELGLHLMPEIRKIHDAERLGTILKSIKTVASPDELRRLWAN
jgi:hypothetical protein